MLFKKPYNYFSSVNSCPMLAFWRFSQTQDVGELANGWPRFGGKLAADNLMQEYFDLVGISAQYEIYLDHLQDYARCMQEVLAGNRELETNAQFALITASELLKKIEKTKGATLPELEAAITKKFRVLIMAKDLTVAQFYAMLKTEESDER